MKDFKAIRESLEREIEEHAEEYNSLVRDCYSYVTDKEAPIDDRIEFFLGHAIGKEATKDVEALDSLSEGDIQVMFHATPHDNQPITADSAWLLNQFDTLEKEGFISTEKKIPFYEQILSYYADAIVIDLGRLRS